MTERRGVKVDGTYDIEASKWDHFVLGVTNHRERGLAVHDTLESLTDELLAAGGTWWSHNGGGYDSLAVLEEARRRGLQMAVSFGSGERVTRAAGGGLTLCDSYALIPLGLERAAELAGRKAYELGWPCECGRKCGGYCAIRPTPTRAQRAELAAYCVEDCETLTAALVALGGYAEQRGYDLRGTIGSSSWATAKRVLGLPDAEYPSAQWRRIRSAYHGGRCSVFRPRVSGRGRHWDLSAAYPSAMATTDFPVGEPHEYGGTDARRCLARERPGIYAATVTIPVSHVPPLPVASRGSVAYPVGQVSGVWTLPELLEAISTGSTVDEVSWCIVWPRSERVLGDLMRTWVGNRLAVGKKTAFGEWERWFAASLAGKLAESPERRFARLHPPMRDIRVCPRRSPCSERRCTGACGAYRQVDEWGEIFSVPYYRQATCGHVQWAAYVTAATRIQWRREAIKHGSDIVYGDTDSIWTTANRAPMPVGDAIGCWELKHGWSDWECVAPKAYAYTDDIGARVIRAAGARVNPDEWRMGTALQDRGVMAFGEAAAASRGLFRQRKHMWTLPSRGRDTGHYGDRVLDEMSGVTHPVTYAELRGTSRR